MLRKSSIILIILVGLSSVVSQAGQKSYTIKDSPTPNSYNFNTWDESQWNEIEVLNDGIIMVNNVYLEHR